jgi:hypothetical protein
MLFARSNASSGVRNVITLSTGPKISSDATRDSSLTGAGEDVRLVLPKTDEGGRTGEGRRVKANLRGETPVRNIGGSQ